MKRFFFLSIFFSVVALCLSSCETDAIDGDGHVEGFWHLERIETLAADSAGTVRTVAEADVSDKLVFWSFQHRLLELDDKADATDRILCRFTADNGTLTIGDTYVPTYGADSIVSDASILARYGMTHLHQTLQVQRQERQDDPHRRRRPPPFASVLTLTEPPRPYTKE